MVYYFIYAKDFSGSTNRCSYYHKNGLQSLISFKNEVQLLKQKWRDADTKTVYLHWGKTCEEVDEDYAVATYMSEKGEQGDTVPFTIIEWITQKLNKMDEIKLLYIITDGMVSNRNTQISAEMNKNIDYDSVVFYAFNEYLNDIDLSVAASFFKKKSIVYCNGVLEDSVDLSVEYDYDALNINNFTNKLKDLQSYIKLKFICSDKNSLNELTKLKNLRRRLFDELSIKNARVDGDLNTRNKEEFLKKFKTSTWYIMLHSGGDQALGGDLKVFIDKNISTLINYITNESKSYSFNALKFQQNYGHYVQEEAITEEDIKFTADVKIEFPDILLDEDDGVPVVILTKLNLLENLIYTDQLNTSFSKFKSTMECPLFLLGNNELSQSIGYYYNLNAFKQLLDHHNFTEPRTRKPFCGGLVLTDTDRFDAYNDYVISATYFDGKKVNYNSGLFYYVLWKLCSDKEWMDKNVLDQFLKYVKRRIETTTCKLSLSSLPMDPQMNTSLLTALWYCVDLSSEIFKNDKINFAYERLRQYHGIAKHMIFILSQFDYDLPMESIDTRLNIIGHVMALKRMHNVHEKSHFILSRIFKTVNGFITNKLEKPQDMYKLNYVNLYHKAVLPDSIINDKVNSLEDYVIFLNQPIKNLQNIPRDDDVKICKDTFRPYFVVDGKAFYSKVLKTMKEVVTTCKENNLCIAYVPLSRYNCNKILSLYKLYTDCVADNTRYPTLEDYTGYILKKKKFSGFKVVVFPFDIHQSIKDVYDQYQTVIANVDVDTFIKTSKLNVARIDRIKQEGVAKFNNDEEILKFIAAEEQDAKLK
ncbi:P94 [Pseudalatia unipuncta granulovirus]|uniref:P94 n=1 Tax=Pseudalatia unipuncta granulosis virus TaxID=36355 RepID=B6S6N9_GVPU|nr:P94 [Pseudalatia unipuncta granulovirus]ACH69370.1 P94 [Pseudalatia unipuncta granulovirus]